MANAPSASQGGDSLNMEEINNISHVCSGETKCGQFWSVSSSETVCATCWKKKNATGNALKDCCQSWQIFWRHPREPVTFMSPAEIPINQGRKITCNPKWISFFSFLYFVLHCKIKGPKMMRACKIGTKLIDSSLLTGDITRSTSMGAWFKNERATWRFLRTAEDHFFWPPEVTHLPPFYKVVSNAK